MSSMFAHAAHQYFYERLQALLAELYGKLGRHPTEPRFRVYQ